jgi:hypothetical protein
VTRDRPRARAASGIFRIRPRRAHPGSFSEGDRAADRHQHGRRQVFLDMLGVFGEVETNLRRERKLERPT